MLEHRRAHRARTMLGARVVFNNGLSSVGCHVRDLTDAGAKLHFEAGSLVPEEFQLEIPLRNFSQKAKVKWRDGQSVGVKFHVEPLPTTAVDLAARIHQLETENAALRRRVADLAKRLDAYGDSERLPL